MRGQEIKGEKVKKKKSKRKPTLLFFFFIVAFSLFWFWLNLQVITNSWDPWSTTFNDSKVMGEIWTARGACGQLKMHIFLEDFQDTILKSKNRFYVLLLNKLIQDYKGHGVSNKPKNLLWIKDSSVQLMQHGPNDLGSICLVKKREIRFLHLRIQSWIFWKKCIFSLYLGVIGWKV